MIATAQPQRSPAWHHTFLAMVPTILRYARHAFRSLPAETRIEAQQEVIANCLVAYARLVELGKHELAYPSVLARYAIAQIRAGRRVGNRWRKRDVYSGNGGDLQHIGCPRDQRGGWREQLVENRATSIPDLAAFRIDFPTWLGTLTMRDRRIALALAAGEQTQEVANTFSVSPGRVSQIRRELAESWQEFHGDWEANADSAA